MDYIEKVLWTSGNCVIHNYSLPPKARPATSFVSRSVRSTQKQEEEYLLLAVYDAIPDIIFNHLKDIPKKGTHIALDLVIHNKINQKKLWGKPACTRADVDNRLKLFLDALQRGRKHVFGGFFYNDNQVFSINVMSLYAPEPSLEFKITIMK